MAAPRQCPHCLAHASVGDSWCPECGKPLGGTTSSATVDDSSSFESVDDDSGAFEPLDEELPAPSKPAPSLVEKRRPQASTAPTATVGSTAHDERMVFDDSDDGSDSGDYDAPSVSPEDDGESLKTGMWRTFGSGLDADIRAQSAVAPRGVRLRRVGASVEIEVLDEGVAVTVDGAATGNRQVVDLKEQVVEVDGVRLSDAMVPLDTIDLSEVPDYFAPILIGRAPDCDFVLPDDAVSGRHAGLSRQEGYLLLEDLDSANGTWVNERRIKRTRLDWRQPFEIGGSVLTPVQVVASVRMERAAQSTSVLSALQDIDLSSAPTAGIEGETADFGLAPGESVVVGRDAAAGLVLDTPNVSRLHARLERRGDGIVVEDLGSTNGTWVNGVRIRKPTLVKPDDDLRIGPQRLQFTADGKVKQDKKQGGASGVRLDASKLVRSVGPAKAPITIIDGVSFSILPGEMVAIMGPSGAGKTSVLTTIAGYTPPSGGTVYMDGLSLYKHYDVFRQAIGYVPQEDVMHRTLTVAEVLYYKARMDFPAEVTDEEIHARITTVLRQLDLEKQRDTIVGDAVRRGLSGGQRRRLNVAMELLGEPSLLLLDEPTSGLDARSAMQLIRQCRGLANGGRTVAMTIHQPRLEAFELFDKLLLLTKGGKLAYFGPTREVKRYFSARSDMPPETAKNPADYVLDVLDPLEESLAHEPAHWRKEFRKSHFYERFVRSRLTREDRSQEREAGKRRRSGDANRSGLFRQTVQLTRRYALLKWRDRQALFVQMAQSPIIGLLAVLLFFKGRYFPLMLQDDITPTLFVLMASSVWFGCSNVAREIVGEAAIFRRERMGTLRPGPYLASKLIVQGSLIALQVGILLAILVPSIPLQGGVLPLLGVSLLAGWSAMALGLLVSAVARTELQAIQFVPLVILPQIMLSGILLPVAGANASKMALWLSKPVLLRWAYSSALHVEFGEATVRGQKALGTGGARFWERNGFGADQLGPDVAVMAALGLACVFLTWFVLSRRDAR